MEFHELLLKYLMGSSYTPNTLSIEKRIELLSQARQMLTFFLAELTFIIETITDKDESKKAFQLGYITGIVDNMLMEVNKEFFNLNMEKREKVCKGPLTAFGDGGFMGT